MAQLEELQVRAGDPPDWLRAAFGREYLAKGMYPEAIAALESAVAVSDSYPQAVALLAHGYAHVGRAEDSRRLTVWLEQRPAHWFAPQLYIALGDTGRAIAMIQGAFERRSSDIVHLRCESVYTALRNQPQIREIVRWIGGPE
jgi:tetratricopeptide (TPR) repeat protein